MTERQLQEVVEQCARLFGWEVYHTWLSARSAPGFPDIIACRASRLLAIELKSATGKLTASQERWLGALGGVPCCEVHVFRPLDWTEGRIEDVLR
jgi:hypothetical protein